MFRNYVVNSGFNVNQRQTSSNMTSIATTTFSASPTPNAFFVADRWIAWRSGFAANGQMALMTLSNTDAPFVSSGLTNFARIGRAVGDTSTTTLNVAQNLESLCSIPMAAKSVTLSFYARVGAGFSGSSGTAVASLGLGVLVDQNVVLGLGAGSSTLSNTWTPTTSWQRQSWTLAIPATATQVCVGISYTPAAGTAVAGDYVDVTGVQLEIASSATPYELRPYAVELPLCQRYFQPIYQPTAMIQNMSNGYWIYGLMLPVGMRQLANTINVPGSTSITTPATGSTADFIASGGFITFYYGKSIKFVIPGPSLNAWTSSTNYNEVTLNALISCEL